MKFCRSQRALHQIPQYTPAPTMYQNNIASPPILTGSLQGPTVLPSLTSFGFSSRFPKQSIQNTPGVGQYQLNPNTTSKKNPKPKIIQKSNLGRGAPSIPFSYYGENMDEEDQRYVQQLMMAEDVMASTNAIKPTTSAFTFPKQSKTHTYIPKNQNLQEIDEDHYQSPQVDAKINENQYKMVLQQTAARRRQLINMINPEFVPSLELVELMTKRKKKQLPGPGEYEISAYNTSMRGITIGKAANTMRASSIEVGPGSYNPTPIKQKKSISIAKSARILPSNTDLMHRFYIDPNPKEFISKSKEQVPFGTGSVRMQYKINKQEYTSITSNKQSKKNTALMDVVKLKLKMIDKKQAKPQGLLSLSTMASEFGN